MDSTHRARVLFICRHNSVRSQMAEGLIRSMCGDRFEAVSAGLEPGNLDPRAVKVMAEIGINISHHRSKSIRLFLNEDFDYVVTVCDNSKEMCPFFPRAQELMHKGFDNPAEARGSEEEVLEVFREVRDQIRDWVSVQFCEAGHSD